MTEKTCIIGVDAGTSFIKAVAFDLEGNEIAKHEIPHEPSQPNPSWFEQDMIKMWDMVQSCLSNVAALLKAEDRSVVGVGLTSTGDGTFLMDGEGNPVRPGIMWCDGRSGKIIEEWHERGIAKDAFDICGTSIFTGSQAAQLNWLRQNEPSVLDKTAVIFHAKDWLFYKLTGVISTDETDESLTMLRMSTRLYDRDLFRIFKIEDLYDKFPTVLESEKNTASIIPDVAVEIGLPRDVLVGSGPMDVAACALGSGAIQHGEASSILGTAGIHQVIMDKPILEPRMVGMTLCHGVKDRWIRMMAAMTATPNLEWFLKQFGPAISKRYSPSDSEIYAEIEASISKIPVGSDGIIFHPYLFPGGERGPFVKPTARASFTGLTLSHTTTHMLRAVYEGVAYSTLDCYRSMPVEASTVYLSGGGANSAVWCQIIADCLGKQIAIPSGSEFGAKGAVINVGLALNAYGDAQEAVKRTIHIAKRYTPNLRNNEIYRQFYEVYRQTYEGQMDIWDLNAQILENLDLNKDA